MDPGMVGRINPPTVLYADDDDNDVLLMRRAWRTIGMRYRLQTVSDGEEAVRYLSGAGPYVSRVEHPMPLLVILDLKMPRISGLDVLDWIRAQSALYGLPVIVLSSSPQKAIADTAIRHRADQYFVKPARFENWLTMVTTLDASWLSGLGARRSAT